VAELSSSHKGGREEESTCRRTPPFCKGVTLVSAVLGTSAWGNSREKRFEKKSVESCRMGGGREMLDFRGLSGDERLGERAREGRRCAPQGVAAQLKGWVDKV